MNKFDLSFDLYYIKYYNGIETYPRQINRELLS